MHPLAVKLADAFVRHFWSADQSIRWTNAEREFKVELAPKVWLVGRVDAEGINEAGEPFFGEWKTIGSKADLEFQKQAWRFDPQALTYGLVFPAGTMFTVRWAQKPWVRKDGSHKPILCDFEWYSYTEAEVEMWRKEVLDIAGTIRALRLQQREHWPLNPSNCFKYGPMYPCPYFWGGCSKLNFTSVLPGHEPRVSHLETERQMVAAGVDPEVVILDATRIEEWLACSERYRRQYEAATTGGGHRDQGGEALLIGGDFHAILKEHYLAMKERQRAQSIHSDAGQV